MAPLANGENNMVNLSVTSTPQSTHQMQAPFTQFSAQSSRQSSGKKLDGFRALTKLPQKTQLSNVRGGVKGALGTTSFRKAKAILSDAIRDVDQDE